MENKWKIVWPLGLAAAGAAALPKEDVTVVLESEVEVPAFFALFVYRDGGLDRVVPEREGNVLTFPWQDALFLFTPRAIPTAPRMFESGLL